MNSRIDMCGASTTDPNVTTNHLSEGVEAIVEKLPRESAATEKRCSGSGHTMLSKITARTVDSVTDTNVDSVSIVSFDSQDDALSIITDTEDHGDNTLKSPKALKTVRFASIFIREYDLCLGDNPAVARGAPVALDWTYKKESKYCSIEDFEESDHSCSARLRLSLKLPSLERLHLLKDLGYSRKEIKEATDRAQLVQKQRFQTRRRVERKDRIQAFFHQFQCVPCFATSNCCFDPSDMLSESISTVSTRSSIDWANVGTDVSMASTQAKTRKLNCQTTTKPKASVNRKQRTRRDWQQKMQGKWERRNWQGQWQRTPRASLDMARHSAVPLDTMNNTTTTPTLCDEQ